MTDYVDIEIGRFPGARPEEEIVVRLSRKEDEKLFSLDARMFYKNKPTRFGFRIKASDIQTFTDLVVNTASATEIFEKEVVVG